MPPIAPEVIIFKSPLNKREKRKFRMRQLEIREKLRNITHQFANKPPSSTHPDNTIDILEGDVHDDHPETSDAIPIHAIPTPSILTRTLSSLGMNNTNNN
ncbi:hypothetical protein EON63_11580, partial [archaeon]